jgi:uncharacterized protein YodC (DUF2158 family)
MEEIKAGDTVRVKSGGPLMTVSSVEDEYGIMTAYCSWFTGARSEKDKFPVTVLVHVNPSEPSPTIRTTRA